MGTGNYGVRDLDSLVARPLPGTEGASSPFWSPDSRALAFQRGSKLERVDISGGAPQVICEVSTGVAGGSWNQHGVIVFGSPSGLWKVSAEGGAPAPLIGARRSPGAHLLIDPSFLPDGRHFLYADVPAEEVYVGSLDAGTERQPTKPLVAGSMAIYAPVADSGVGQIMFIKPIPDGRLMAQAFDPSRAELEGDPTPLAERVSSFAVASNGVLAYIAGQQIPLQLTWFDRQGKVLGTLAEPSIYPTPAISPDGKTVAVPVPRRAGGLDIWLYDSVRGTRSRFTFRRKVNQTPVWSPDGSRMAFFSPHAGAPTVYEKAVDGIGQAEPLENAPRPLLPVDWSRDGHYLIEQGYDRTYSIWVQALSPERSGGARNPVPYLKDTYNAINGRLSPNGQ